MQSTRSFKSCPKSGLNLYLAFPEFENDLAQELGHFDFQIGRLFVSSKPIKPPLVWAQLTAQNACIASFKSIKEASNILHNAQLDVPHQSNSESADSSATQKVFRRWANYSSTLFRRSELIQEATFKFKEKKFKFLEEIPANNWGIWSLLDNETLIYSSDTNSSLPLGEVQFHEDKVNPPSRAYLKLWETFTVHGVKPEPGQHVIDMGSCPGGWTWVLKNLNCQVTSVDKAPLHPDLMKSPLVSYIKKDAFTLKPSEIKPVDWFFSDIICYPPKLLELVQYWRNEGQVKNFVCTIKFQGETDFKTMDEFLKIPNSRIIHLCHNKHEVTWILTEK